MVSSTVASVPMAVIPVSGLGISRPLAIIMMSVGVRRSITISVMYISMAVVGISRLGSGSGLGSGGRLSISLSISGPLAVVVASVASISSMVASTVASIPVASIAIAGRGGNNSEEDDGESNQKFHVV